jgi:tRNA G18 (ribose-2'-O)-methylase SpoU
MRSLVLIAHNLRSTHNVGSLFRTADGLSVDKVILTGYTPYPRLAKDPRLPHLAAKIDRQIAKAALGAEKTVQFEHFTEVELAFHELKQAGYETVALEQAPKSIALPDFQPTDKVALVVGREVEGLEPAVLKLCDRVVEIPMLGKKESYNVAQAAAMALYHCRFTN